MPFPTTYSTGTASVANGATTVSLVGAVTGAIYAGDLFCDPAQPLVPPQRIATDPVAGVFELAVAWPGTSLTADPYEVRITPDSARMSERTRRVLDTLQARSEAWKGPWVTATDYVVTDEVEHDGSSYICVLGHTSGTFATDLAAVKWQLLAAAGTDGTNGTNGTNGADGYSPGYRLTFSTTTTDADPGAGAIRFNHATFASITQLFVDNQDAAGVSLTTWLDGLDDISNANARAYIRFQKATDPTVYAEFAVTGAVTDGTGYRKVPVTPVAGAVPANATVLVATAAKSGADGAGAVSSVNGLTGAVIVPTGGFLNRLINGNGAINQRGATSQADDTYGWDRHYVLTQTAAIGVSSLSDVSNGLPSLMRLTQSQVTAQRMGVAQIVESVNCKDLRGQAVTLLGKLRCSASQAIRYAILEWTGTADAPVSDVVNSWTNGTFTAGQFFNSTTLTVTQVGTITPSAATVTDFLLTTTLGSSVNNVIVLIWTEGTAAQNVTLDVAWEFLKGNNTGKTYPVEVRSRGQEIDLCKRYWQLLKALPTLTAFSTTAVIGPISWPLMRGTPTIGATGVLRITKPGTNIYDQSSVSFAGTALTPDGGDINLSNFTGLTGGTIYQSYFSNNGNYITLDGEI